MDKDVYEAAMIFGSKVSPILERKLKELGVSSPEDLPREVGIKILVDASTEAALINFPHANVEKLQHGLRSFSSPRFGASFREAKRVVDKSTDAFEMCVGPDAAIVLAAFGVKVAPFDRRTLRIVGQPSNDIDAVAGMFDKMKTAFVGFSPCDEQFYCLVTDSLSDLKRKLESENRLEPIRKILSRAEATLPPGNGSDFQHFGAVFARFEDDRFETFFLEDPRPDRGSVLFPAGWSEDDRRFGAPNDGFMPVPLALLRGAIADPQLAFWLTEPKGQRVLH
ncbi:hypothetical protein ACCC88_06090 [Sphingomonas sp. Sphisp140]|uniref:hypothetical protein n=1 Tax=unclassified Sphingomonas TaxID=196159 RepID=UPI0039AF9D11